MSDGFAQESLPIEAPAKSQRVSRDEMNLAEFPLTVLSTRANTGLKTLEFKDTIRGKNGEVVNRSWIITGADKFGLPTSSDDEILLGLVKLTVDEGFHDRKVYFTRYALLRILRWTTEGRNYVRLQKALDRLSGVRIKATNAFYDNDAKSHSTRNFGILDAYELNDGRNTNPKPSFFIWSEVIFKSFQAGFIKKLDLDFYLELESAVSKRLYRYLDKHFWYRNHVQANLFILAHEKVGISRNYQYASSLRQQLDPAMAELREKGFISDFNYEGKGRDTLVHIFAPSGPPRAVKARGDKVEVLPALTGQDLRATIIQALTERGLTAKQADKLTRERDSDTLARMSKIIDHFDSLVASQSRLVSKSPIGFLYRAVESPETFVLPQDNKSQQTTFPFSNRYEQGAASRPATVTFGAGKFGAGKSGDGKSETIDQLRAEYLVVRKKGLQNLREEVEPDLLKKVSSEVESALIKLRGLISENRYQEAITHGVEEKLAKLFAFPEFEEWLKSKRGRNIQ